MMNPQSVDEIKVELIKLLIETKCVKFGQFKLKSGADSPYYFDLRKSTKHLNLYAILKDLLAEKVEYIKTRDSKKSVAIVGVPYGVVPLAGAVSDRCNLPYYPIRKETKGYGCEPDLDDCDEFHHIMIEDVMSSGSSIVDAVKKLGPENVSDIIVVVDRELGGREKLKIEYPNIKIHSVLNLSDIKSVLSSSDSDFKDKELLKVLLSGK